MSEEAWGYSLDRKLEKEHIYNLSEEVDKLEVELENQQKIIAVMELALKFYRVYQHIDQYPAFQALAKLKEMREQQGE